MSTGVYAEWPEGISHLHLWRTRDRFKMDPLQYAHLLLITMPLPGIPAIGRPTSRLAEHG